MLPESALEQVARSELAGVGDAELGEWVEWSGYAYHVRRRLTLREQTGIGPAVDVRGTPEAGKRVKAALARLPKVVQDRLRAEGPF